MRIRVVRTGGFAGLKVQAEADSVQLSGARERELKRLAKQARLFDQPAKPSTRATPDQFQYEFTVEDEGRTHSFVTNDAAASDELIELVDWLIANALKQN